MSRDRIIEVVEQAGEVAFATLFGSRAGEAHRPDSDWDIALYLYEDLSAAERDRVRDAVIAALEPGLRVDIVILNDAPALLAHRALAGERLLVRDKRAWVRFFVHTLAAAGDEAYWRDLHMRERERRLEEGRFGRP